MDRGLWQATVHRIAQICTQLKQLSMLTCTSAHYTPDTLWSSGNRCSPCPQETLNLEGEADSKQTLTQAEEICVSYESYGWLVTVLMTGYSGGFVSLSQGRVPWHNIWRISRRYPHGEEESTLCGQDNMGTNRAFSWWGRGTSEKLKEGGFG